MRGSAAGRRRSPQPGRAAHRSMGDERERVRYLRRCGPRGAGRGGGGLPLQAVLGSAWSGPKRGPGMRPRAARRAAGGSKGCSPTPGPPKGGGGAAGSRGVQGVSPCAALPLGDGSRRSRRGCASEQRHERERMDARGDAVRVERTGKGPGEVSPGGLLAGTRGAGAEISTSRQLRCCPF